MVTVTGLGVGMTGKDFLGCWKSMIGTRRRWFVLSQFIGLNSRYLCPAIYMNFTPITHCEEKNSWEVSWRLILVYW